MLPTGDRLYQRNLSGSSGRNADVHNRGFAEMLLAIVDAGGESKAEYRFWPVPNRIESVVSSLSLTDRFWPVPNREGVKQFVPKNPGRWKQPVPSRTCWFLGRIFSGTCRRKSAACVSRELACPYSLLAFPRQTNIRLRGVNLCRYCKPS